MSEPVEPRRFRRIMGMFPTGVTVLAAEYGSQVHAMTANAITSLSLDPLLVLVCIAKQARFAGFLEACLGFSVNILRTDQRALSNYFAGGWDQESAPPPFRFVPWEGGPRLEGCLAAVGCAKANLMEGGDHWILTGRVVAVHQGIEPHQPLVFFHGRYGRLDTTQGDPAPDLGWETRPVQVYYDPWQEDV